MADLRGGVPTLYSPLPEPTHASVLARLPYFVDWRPRLWVPTVRWLLGDPARFQGKTVLEFGCRSGRMSCLFGLLGAQVLGVELPDVSLEKKVSGTNGTDL